MDIDAIERPDPERPDPPDPPDPESIVHAVNYSTIYYPYNLDQPDPDQPDLD